MKVKICGITDLKTAQSAINAGADAVGFVFAESKRRIEISEAKKIIESLPDSILKIGVFVNETKETLESIYQEVGLTHIQLHGDETPEFCRSLSFPVIKALRVQSEKDVEKIAEYDCDYILVDSPSGKYRGGNGTTFNWELMGSKKIDNLILAGGLTIENVIPASSVVKPKMVDVSSGVETNGKKDQEKIKSFIKKVKLGGI
ncbi:N-(5'-phosphoribosyl)anthranilate isomerase [Bacillus sp. FJAT-25509]|uniref:phosphoribosylanthranilate isomerase n=1 Tax=Bacillus sp. FJAT-25509 TaxID=1712029 RepID=UPI0006FBAAE4|nr:phosphoribosylanthranilate isomerase [Bacillus sp. FJAT-25509]KQL40008.1 N-(5'-phosphoribosyl)anthranilate isomerase [Bacillus sp. FJAT-25509]